MSYTVVWADRAANDMRALARRNPAMARRVGQAVTSFAQTGQGDVKKLTGQPEHRLRVGDWRAILELDNATGTIRVTRVLPRGRAYRER